MKEILGRLLLCSAFRTREGKLSVQRICGAIGFCVCGNGYILHELGLNAQPPAEHYFDAILAASVLLLTGSIFEPKK